MDDIFETPRQVRLVKMSDRLNVSHSKTAAAMWAAGHGTYMIAIALFPQSRPDELPEHRVWNSMEQIKGYL